MLIRADSACLAYGNFIAVESIDLDVKKGEIISIIGPNGSGKSTVLKALTRLIRYKKGSISLNGEEINIIDSKAFAQKIAVLPQKHIAPPDFKVKDLLAYGRVPHQKWYERLGKEDEAVIEKAMADTQISHLKDKSIMECSGGEAQRVWIATVLCQNPEILFLDEPTTFLDVAHQIETMKLIKKLNRESGIGVVMVLHDIAQAFQVSDRIVVIKEGKIYDEGKPEKVICPQMMQDVYKVDCDIIRVEGRKKPLIAFKEI